MYVSETKAMNDHFRLVRTIFRVLGQCRQDISVNVFIFTVLVRTLDLETSNLSETYELLPCLEAGPLLLRAILLRLRTPLLFLIPSLAFDLSCSSPLTLLSAVFSF